MISTILNHLKDFVINNAYASQCLVTNYQYFVPKSYPAVAIDVREGRLVDESYSLTVQDSVYAISIVYIEKAPTDRDKIAFIQNVENIKKALRQDPVLNETVQGLKLSSTRRDRGREDNLEFIEEILLTGQIEI